MFNTQKDPWEAALASDEFYFKYHYPLSPESPKLIFKMKRLNTATFLCTEAADGAINGREWSIREIREYGKYWTLVDNPNKQEKANVNDNELYQKINAKQKLLDRLNKRSIDLEEQAKEVIALVCKEECQLAELKRGLLSALKKELGS